MKKQMILAGRLASVGTQARYDENVKALLGEKIILAHILVWCVDEFAGMDPEAVLPCIEGEIETEAIPLLPGESNSPHIHGENNEDSVPYEGVVTYDIRVRVRSPGRERLQILINVEAQLKFHPGYDLVTRGIYYGARMLSSQMGVEFTGKSYDRIKKSYSIWICMRVPRRLENTVTEYRIAEQSRLGAQRNLGRYDLMRVVFVGLSQRLTKAEGTYQLHRFLETLVLPDLPLVKRQEILEQEYGIPMTNRVERRLEQMSNLGEQLAEVMMERGIRKGKRQGRRLGRREGMERVVASFLRRDNRVSEAVRMLGVPEQLVRGVAAREKIEVR